MVSPSSLRLWFFLCFLFLTGLLAAQSPDLLSFNEQRLQTNKRAMVVLGSWAVGNIALGAGLMSRHQGSEKYFHQMNWIWNTVNLGIAGLGYWQAARQDPAALDLYQSVNEHYNMQKILLLNAGLDIGYMAGGLYLIERSKNSSKNANRFKGWGKSIILQGGFLFAFDLFTYFIHQSHNRKVQNLLQGLHFNGQEVGLFIQF